MESMNHVGTGGTNLVRNALGVLEVWTEAIGQGLEMENSSSELTVNTVNHREIIAL